MLPMHSSSNARSSLVNCAGYDAAGRRLPDFGLDQVDEVLASGSGFVWVGVHEPDADLLDKLQHEFGLHDLAVEDAHKAHQRPKIETYGESLFIVLHTAQAVNGAIAMGETHIFLGPNYLLTVRHGASMTYAPARERCEREPELLSLGPSYALYAVTDLIVDNYLPIVRDFEADLRALEDDIFAKSFKRETIERLYRLKRELTSLRLAVSPLQDILNQLTRFYPGLIHDDVRLHYRDVFDHAKRANEATDTLREMMTAAMSVNLSLVTISQGEVVKRLAGWAALIAGPTLIASWYGMNFVHMPELQWEGSYAVIVTLTVVLSGGLFLLLKRARWL